MSKASVITARQEAFCVNYVECANEHDAYRAAFEGGPSMDSKRVKDAARKLLKQSKIVARINYLRDQVAEKAGYSAADVIRHLVEIATADPNDLVSYRRTACRFCHGRDNQHQWVDANEFARVTAETLDHNSRCRPTSRKPLPDDQGGYGFNAKGDPHPECPRCHGDGLEAVHITDTRRLTKSAKRLYAGVKKTKEGIEVKTHDQTWALGLLAKHFRVIGTDGTTINVNTGVTNIADNAAVPLDPQEAAKFYQNLMQGKK